MPRIIKRKFKNTILYAPREWTPALQKLSTLLRQKFTVDSFDIHHGNIGIDRGVIRNIDDEIKEIIEGLRYSNILDTSVDVDSEIRDVIRRAGSTTERQTHHHLEELYNEYNRAEERKNQSNMEIIENRIVLAQHSLEDISRYMTELWNIGENNANPMDEGAGIYHRRIHKKQRKIKIK